jgi:hypothetical protein
VPEPDQDQSPFADFVTLRDVARMLGTSYVAAHSLAAAGLLGEPVVSGRSHFYSREVAEAAVRRRLEQLKRNARAPLRDEES